VSGRTKQGSSYRTLAGQTLKTYKQCQEIGRQAAARTYWVEPRRIIILALQGYLFFKDYAELELRILFFGTG